MPKSFDELKRQYKGGKAFTDLQEHIRYDLGAHKKTRLKLAGAENSGSLLHDNISKVHAQKLSTELRNRADKAGTSAKNRFRFMTILQAVVEPSEKMVSTSVEALEGQFQTIIGDLGLWSRGTIELEMVNLTILEKISSLSDNEARKLNVLTELGELQEFMGLMIPTSKSLTRVLVHCHVVVDLGKTPEATEEEIRKRIRSKGYWNKSKYQVEIKGLFKNRAVSTNLNKIAAYVVKGGNENLRYNAGFGRDLAEDLEAKIWRAGTGRKDKGAETIEDERGLTVAEVKRLDELYVWLMKRRRDKRGYLIGSNGRV
jgi:hypothetical protein